MTRFDFRRDGLPDAVEAVLAFRLPRRLHTAAATLIALLCVFVACSVLETIRVSAASALERGQEQRFEAVRDRLAAANLELEDVRKLLETDRRLHAVRGSGTRAVSRLTRIGNLVPRGVWLRSIEPADAGLRVEGEALDVDALRRAIANFVADGHAGKARLLRMEREPRPSGPALVTFTLHLGDAP